VNFSGKGEYRSPEFSWLLPIAPTSLTFLSSDKLGKIYENDLFVGDFNNGNIYRFDLNQNRNGLIFNSRLLQDKVANNATELNLAIFAQGFGGITDLQMGPDGYLYMVSIKDGKIYRIVPASLSQTENK
jgi:glucose/arabinose dehydrogenase